MERAGIESTRRSRTSSTSIISKYLVADNSKLNIVLFVLVFVLSLNLHAARPGGGAASVLGGALVFALVAGGLVAAASSTPRR